MSVLPTVVTRGRQGSANRVGPALVPTLGAPPLVDPSARRAGNSVTSSAVHCGEEKVDPRPGRRKRKERGNQRWGLERPLRLFLQELPVLQLRHRCYLSPLSLMCVCVCVSPSSSLSLWIPFFLSFSGSFSVLCVLVRGAGSLSPFFLSISARCLSLSLCLYLLCMFLSPSYYVLTSLCLCLSVSFHSLFPSRPLSLFVSSLSRSVSHPVPPQPPPASTCGLRVSVPSLPSPHPWQLLMASQSWPLLPAPLGPWGRGRGKKGGQPGGPTPFCLSRLGGWASGPFNQPGQAVPDTSPGHRAWPPRFRQPPAWPPRSACSSSPHPGPWLLRPSRPSLPTATSP